MLSTIHTDILIIGAGPAGASASHFLAKAGVSHVIVDAAEFPRDKICGDGLDMKVFRVLNQLNPEALQSLFAHPELELTYGLRFIQPDRREVNWIHKPTPLTHPSNCVMKRTHFDAFMVDLIDRRFADFRTKTKVTKLRRKESGGWVAETADGLEIHTKLLIGADGDHSLVLHTIGDRKINRRHYCAALRQYWTGVEGFHPEKLLEVYVPAKKPMSYFWLFPLPNGEANIGYGMVSELAAKTGENLRETFKDLIQNDPVLAHRFANAKPLETVKGWGIPMASNPDRVNAGKDYLLVGDAASHNNPANGEGIGSGMISGILAAKFAEQALVTGNQDHFGKYDAELRRRLADEIKVYNFLMRWQLWRVQDWMLPFATRVYDFQKRLDKYAPTWVQTVYERPVTVEF